MATVGGDILDIVITNQQAGTHTFYPMGSESATMSLGGPTMQSDVNGVAGGGAEMVFSRQSERGYFEVVCACDTAVREDNVKYREFQSSQYPSTATITLNNGTVYKFTGFPVGSVEMDTLAATFTFRIEGNGEKIA